MPTAMVAADLPLVLTVEEFRAVMRISRQKAYDIIHQQNFPAIRVGRVIRIPREAFLRWLGGQ
jgi:excisionase family DNA binding protein